MCKDVQMSPNSVYEIPAPFKKGCFTDLEMTTAVLTIVAYTLAMLIAIGFCAGFNSKNCLSEILALRKTAKNTSDNLPTENGETGSLLSQGHADTKTAVLDEEKDGEIPSNQSEIDADHNVTEVAKEIEKEPKSEKSMKDYFTTFKTSSEKFAKKHFNFNKSDNEETKTPPDKPDESTTDIIPEKPARNSPVTPDK